VVTGNTLSGDFDIVVRKYDAAGNLLVNNLFDAGTAECGITIEPVPGSGYICSATYGFNPSFDPWILRLDDNLDTVFTKIMDFTYGIAGNTAKEYSVYPSGNGFIICGADSNRLMLRKTDAMLNTVWQQLYGGVMGESGYEGIHTSDGGIAAIGLTFSFGAGSADIYFVKTDSLGTVQGPSGIESYEENKFEVYPNPFTDYINIRQYDKNSKLVLYDVTGKILRELIFLDTQVRLDLSELKNGIYLMTSESESGIQRLILFKQ
jgi:hypothetical protein